MHPLGLTQRLLPHQCHQRHLLLPQVRTLCRLTVSPAHVMHAAMCTHVTTPTHLCPPVPTPWVEHAGDYCSTTASGGTLLFDVRGLSLGDCQARCTAAQYYAQHRLGDSGVQIGDRDLCLCVAYLDASTNSESECKGANIAAPKHSSEGWSAYTH
jgi:hypothetical protein